jgi:hypothetical protein
MKNVGTIADDLSLLEIDSQKIQEEEEVRALTIFSGSENNSISNINFKCKLP